MGVSKVKERRSHEVNAHGQGEFEQEFPSRVLGSLFGTGREKYSAVSLDLARNIVPAFESMSAIDFEITI